jgi:hypothetical protein
MNPRLASDAQIRKAEGFRFFRCGINRGEQFDLYRISVGSYRSFGWSKAVGTREKTDLVKSDSQPNESPTMKTT